MSDTIICQIPQYDNYPAIRFADFLMEQAHREAGTNPYLWGWRDGLFYCAKVKIYPSQLNTHEQRLQAQDHTYIEGNDVQGFKDAVAWYEANKDRFVIKYVDTPNTREALNG